MSARSPVTRRAEAAFLDNHRRALGKLLDIRFVEARPERVLAEIVLGPGHMTDLDSVQGGVIMALGDMAGAYGAMLNAPEGMTTVTLESKTNFLRRGSGPVVWGEARPVHVGRRVSVWRTRVGRGSACGEGGTVAEVTQTEIVVEAPPPPAEPKASPERATGEPPAPGADTVAEQRREQILRAATEVMSRRGYAKASVREIAQAAGMPIATMYKYVRSKEDVLSLIYERFLEQVTEALSGSVAREGRAGARLETAIRATLRIFDGCHEEVKLLFRESKSLSPRGRERVYELDRAYLALWQELLRERLPAGEGREARVDLLANCIYYLCTVWALRHWAIGGHGLAAVEDAACNLVLHGVPGYRPEHD